MWLEPKNEYLHRKIVVEQTFTEGRLSREIFVLDNVKISDVDGRPVVMEGTISRTWFKKEGNKSEWSSVQTIRRSNIRWNPDFAAMGAFQMDFPEGAIIHDLDDQTLEYKWRKGTLQKYVRPKCVGGNKAVPDKDR